MIYWLSFQSFAFLSESDSNHLIEQMETQCLRLAQSKEATLTGGPWDICSVTDRDIADIQHLGANINYHCMFLLKNKKNHTILQIHRRIVGGVIDYYKDIDEINRDLLYADFQYRGDNTFYYVAITDKKRQYPFHDTSNLPDSCH